MKRNNVLLRKNILESLDRILSENATGMKDVTVKVDLDAFHSNEYPYERSYEIVSEIAMDRIRTAVYNIGGLGVNCSTDSKGRIHVTFRVHNSLTERDIFVSFKSQYLPLV